MTRQILILTLSAFVGIVLAFFFNYFILDKILIPDPCYYHSHDTNKLFDIFYNLPASEGYHPFPTKFNFVFTTIIGAILGLTISIYKRKIS